MKLIKNTTFYFILFYFIKSEWSSKEPIKKGWRGLWIQQYFSNFFVDEARKNPQCFSSSLAEYRKLISHTQPIYKFKFGMPIYFFRHEPIVLTVNSSAKVKKLQFKNMNIFKSIQLMKNFY